jgi:hypothetical protein
MSMSSALTAATAIASSKAASMMGCGSNRTHTLSGLVTLTKKG